MLLKHLSIVKITAVVCAILATTLQIANASPSSVASIDRDNLTVKPKKETSTNIDRQSEVESIHKTLTQTYRGLNGCNVNLVAKHVLMRGRYLSDLDNSCNLRRQGDLQLNYEVKNIELVSLSGNNATVNIYLSQTFQYHRVMKRPSIQNQSISCVLIKDDGRWKVSNFFIKESVPVGDIYPPGF
jgi:hypothetical protein